MTPIRRSRYPGRLTGCSSRCRPRRASPSHSPTWRSATPCQKLRKEIIFGGYIGINDVNGVDCAHLAFSSRREDLQLWLVRSGKPIPLKLVINYRTEPGSPEYIATLSDWKFPTE